MQFCHFEHDAPDIVKQVVGLNLQKVFLSPFITSSLHRIL